MIGEKESSKLSQGSQWSIQETLITYPMFACDWLSEMTTTAQIKRLPQFISFSFSIVFLSQLMCRTNWHPRGVSQRSRTSPLDSLMRPSEVGSREMLVGEEDESVDSDGVANSSGYETDDESSHPRVPSYRRSEHLLVEVGLCFDRSNQLVDCPVKGRLRGCRQDDPLLLPPVGTFETLSN